MVEWTHPLAGSSFPWHAKPREDEGCQLMEYPTGKGFEPRIGLRDRGNPSTRRGIPATVGTTVSHALGDYRAPQG